MGIHWLLHSSCCFLNTNTMITQQLTATARMLKAEWWQVCGEVWVRGQRKMSQVLGAFGLLDFTMLWPILAWHAFLTLWTVYFFHFPNCFSGRSQPWITETMDTESVDMEVQLYILETTIHFLRLMKFTKWTQVCKYTYLCYMLNSRS